MTAKPCPVCNKPVIQRYPCGQRTSAPKKLCSKVCRDVFNKLRQNPATRDAVREMQQ